MECALGSEAKNVNGALHAHPMNRRRRYEKKLVRNAYIFPETEVQPQPDPDTVNIC